MNKKVNSTRHK